MTVGRMAAPFMHACRKDTESAIRRVVNLRIKGNSIYWLAESVDAILLLRSFYKARRWPNLQRMATAVQAVSL